MLQLLFHSENPGELVYEAGNDNWVDRITWEDDWETDEQLLEVSLHLEDEICSDEPLVLCIHKKTIIIKVSQCIILSYLLKTKCDICYIYFLGQNSTWYTYFLFWTCDLRNDMHDIRGHSGNDEFPEPDGCSFSCLNFLLNWFLKESQRFFTSLATKQKCWDRYSIVLFLREIKYFIIYLCNVKIQQSFPTSFLSLYCLYKVDYFLRINKNLLVQLQ